MTLRHTVVTLEYSHSSLLLKHTFIDIPSEGSSIRCNTLLHTDTLQHTATYCTTLQHIYICTYTNNESFEYSYRSPLLPCSHACTYTAGDESPTRCNTLYHTVTRCNTLQHMVPRCNTLQHTPGDESPTHLRNTASVYLLLNSSNFGATTWRERERERECERESDGERESVCV